MVSAQRRRADRVSLVSGGSQQRAFSEPSAASPMTRVERRVEVGTACKLIISRSQCSEGARAQGAPGAASGRRAAVEVWLHGAGALRNPIRAHRLAC